jgi:toxin ParE1/3/4
LKRCHYIIALEASQDLDEIGDDFLARNVEAGERWFQAFSQKCQLLARFPEMGRGYPYIRSYLRGLPLEDLLFFIVLKMT